jgi:hypothetical protein
VARRRRRVQKLGLEGCGGTAAAARETLGAAVFYRAATRRPGERAQRRSSPETSEGSLRRRRKGERRRGADARGRAAREREGGKSGRPMG